MPDFSRLELDEADLRALVAAALDRICGELRGLPGRAACVTEGGAALARSLREPLPRSGAPLPELLATIFERALPVSYTTTGPGYLAYIPGGGLLHAAVADLIADAINRFVGLWRAAPGLVQLESNVIMWLCEIVGLPAGSGGVLTSGGSLANFSATVAARHRLGERFVDGTIYTSTQAHHSVLRAAILAGFPAAQVRAVEVDAQQRICLDRLAEAIAGDRAAGLRPCMLVASAGTTNTGAVDDLEGMAGLAEREGLWLHVDAAYGGCFALTERGRATLRGLGRADSITLDPHKGLFLPYGTGALLVRDPAALRRAHSVHAEYLPPMQEDPDFVDFCELSPELSRDFRGLRLWLPLKLVGADGFAAALDEKLDLAAYAAGVLRGMPEVLLVAPPQLSLLVFRHVPARLGGDPAAQDDHNERLLAAINRRGRVFLTSTRLAGRFVLRICVLSFRTHRDRVDEGLVDISEAIAELG
ncbi:aminotransferase class V-fold PLP-dependent enzyme [Nannocystis sp.]|uniref:pyridoxal phosphate-dependent decarboxylase family protein n=1 Tax=Nannocystis sp. TaxID=1962667 RepID=UPI0025F94F39|nr:aminotransferase class V-fold PLP-dependent enzyme [Nannocystis sp.]